MKKILGIMGSPTQKGQHPCPHLKNTRRCKIRGGCGEILFLDDLAIRECDGCHRCWQGKECNKDDDMNKIYPKIMESAGIVFRHAGILVRPNCLDQGLLDRLSISNCPENRKHIKGQADSLSSALRGR